MGTDRQKYVVSTRVACSPRGNPPPEYAGGHRRLLRFNGTRPPALSPEGPRGVLRGDTPSPGGCPPPGRGGRHTRRSRGSGPATLPPCPGTPGAARRGRSRRRAGPVPPLLRLRRATERRQRPRLSPRGSGAGREELRARGREAATYPPSLRRRFGERPPEESPRAAEPC